MIESVFVVTPERRIACPGNDGHKFSIDLSSVDASRPVDIEINFTEPIESFRNHDYRWADTGKPRISNVFTPKAIRLANGCFVQPSVMSGIWETDPRRPKRLLWRFNLPDAAPLGVFHGFRHTRKIEDARGMAPASVALLFSFRNAVEFSRSPIPFSAVACFTDHCDYDTAENLVLQRELFKRCGVRVTKGFFMNHFSSRADNASFENQADELTKWRADGHELAYHSLEQAARSDDAESFADFERFRPPFDDLTTWIDHAYQPYNLSLYANHGKSDAYFAEMFKSKNIRSLWNYIDSGATTSGIINQLNRDDFTLGRVLKGHSGLGFKKRMSLLLRNIMLFYYADEQVVRHYMYAAINVKKVLFSRKLKQLRPMMRHLAGMIPPLAKVLFGWGKCKDKPFRLAKYAPVVFRHRIDNEDFYIFQTLDMADFTKSLSPENLDKLVAESGLFIAHTYFSVPLSYHHGKMFREPNIVDPNVEANFMNLGAKIKAGEIWNPTLGELVDFLANFETTLLDTDAQGNIFVAQSGLPYRNVI